MELPMMIVTRSGNPQSVANQYCKKQVQFAYNLVMYATLGFSFIVHLLFVASGTASGPRAASPIKLWAPGDISKQKCKEYAQYAYDKSKSSHVSGALKCVYDATPSLIGDVRPKEGEFPHMALLGYQSEEEVEWQCGGSLISENFILTAAHCLNSRIVGSPKFVRVGLTNQLGTKNMQESTVSEVIVYPEFNNTPYHDIGLIKLSKKLDLNGYVRPACLQTEKTIRGSKVVAPGWGQIDFSDAAEADLIKLFLEISDAEKCNRTYKNSISPRSKLKYGIRDDLMVCAGTNQLFKDTCQSSGGPLQLDHQNDDIKCMYDIVGVTSFGRTCGLPKEDLRIFTRVSAYLKWIEDTVWPQ